MNDSLHLSTQAQEILLNLAPKAIEYGLHHRTTMPVETQEYAEELQTTRAVFVTLTIDNELRGCIGTLEATNPLVCAVVKYAYAAAFSDPRFSPVTIADLKLLEIHISVLSNLEPLSFTSESDLLRQIRPGIDGLLLEEDYHRGTLLPSVWEDIPQKEEFLRRLKLKAGLSPNHWSNQLSVKRYTAFCFP